MSNVIAKGISSKLSDSEEQTIRDNLGLGSNIVTKTDNQALHDTDALRISGSTLYLYKGDGGNESVTLPSSAPTAAQVGAATAGLAVGSVGSYALLACESLAVRNQGSILAGSSLSYANAYTYGASQSGRSNNVPSGTWRLMGQVGRFNNTGTASVHNVMVSVWLRIS